jgi:N-acyl-phosphatidylethanolamine-hydrolysing phospholipase D
MKVAVGKAVEVYEETRTDPGKPGAQRSGIAAARGRSQRPATGTGQPPAAMMTAVFHPLRPAAVPASMASMAALALALLTGCAHVNPYFDPSRPHHTPSGFRNVHTAFDDKGLGELLRWRMAALRDDLPPRPAQPVPTVAPDLAFLHANAAAGTAMQPAITWIGHATMLAQFGGTTLITDPMFSPRASPLEAIGPQRAQPPALLPPQLPRVDLVLISHNHYDHLDEASVRALSAQPGGPPLFVVPLGIGRWLAGRGITHVVELDWWQSQRMGALEIVLTPAQHWSGRSLTDRLDTLWGGFAVFAPDFHFFYAGDTGYSRDFADIRERFAARQRRGGGFDIALIPIGAYEPRWFMAGQHVNPDEAVRVHRDLGAKASVGVHWGSFELSDEALDEPPRALAAARAEQGVAETQFFVLAIGETRRLPRRARQP